MQRAAAQQPDDDNLFPLSRHFLLTRSAHKGSDLFGAEEGSEPTPIGRTHETDSRRGIVCTTFDVWDVSVVEFLESTDRDATFCRVVMPDVFLERVQRGMAWSFFDGRDAAELRSAAKNDFAEAYAACEARGNARRTASASEIYRALLQNKGERKRKKLFLRSPLIQSSAQQH